MSIYMVRCPGRKKNEIIFWRVLRCFKISFKCFPFPCLLIYLLHLDLGSGWNGIVLIPGRKSSSSWGVWNTGLSEMMTSSHFLCPWQQGQKEEESALVLFKSVEEEVERLESSSLETLCGNSITLSSGPKVIMVMMMMVMMFIWKPFIYRQKAQHNH